MSTQTELTVQQAVERYLHSLDPEARANSQAELQRFIRWYGGDKPLSGILPHELESYGGTITATTTHGRRRLEALRAFLAYLKRAGVTKDNLSVHVRIARSSTNDKSSQVAAPTIRLTPEGFVQLEQELESLRGQRTQIAEDLRLAMADKDFRENAPLDAAREQQAHVEARIREIENTLRHATVIEHSERRNHRTAQVGSTIRLKDLQTGREMTYVLVERSEVDVSQGKISVDSPVGRAVLGCAQGKEIEVETPGGMRKFKLEATESA